MVLNLSQGLTNVLQTVKCTAGFNCSIVDLDNCEHCQQNNNNKKENTHNKKTFIL